MKQERSTWTFPADMIALVGIPVFAIAGLIFAVQLQFTVEGDPTLLYLAVVMGILGTGFLLAARLPLYRQRKFFSFGPGELDARHRRLYKIAYAFMFPSVILLVLVWTILK